MGIFPETHMADFQMWFQQHVMTKLDLGTYAAMRIPSPLFAPHEFCHDIGDGTDCDAFGRAEVPTFVCFLLGTSSHKCGLPWWVTLYRQYWFWFLCTPWKSILTWFRSNIFPSTYLLSFIPGYPVPGWSWFLKTAHVKISASRKRRSIPKNSSLCYCYL